MPVLSTLIDNFDDNTKDTGKWATPTVPAGGLYFGTEDGTVSETGGALRMEVTWDGDSSDFVGYSSASALTFNGSGGNGEARIQIKEVDATSLSTLYLSVGEQSFPPGHNAEWQVEITSATCTLRAARNYFGGSGTAVTLACGWQELVGLWLIIRGDGDDTVWEIAPNDRGIPGTRREIRRDIGANFPPMGDSFASVVLTPAFVFGQDSVPRIAVVDNFNFSPTQADSSATTSHVGAGGSTTSLTTSAVTPSGDNRATLVFTNFAEENNNHVGSVRYNNSSGTVLNTLSEDYQCDLFGFAFSQFDVRGAAGTPNTSTAMYAGFPGNPFSNAIIALHLEDVDQTTPFGTTSTATGYVVSHTPVHITHTRSDLDPYQKLVLTIGVLLVGVDNVFSFTAGPNSKLLRQQDGVLGSEPRWVTLAAFEGYADENGYLSMGIDTYWDYATDDQYSPYRVIAVPVNTATGGGGSPITGDANITETGDSSTTDVDVLVQGTSTLTEGANTLSATAGVLVTANATIAGTDDTVSSGASVPATGNASITESADTVSSGLTHPVVGTSTITEVGDTLSSGLTHPVTGTATITEAAETLSSGLTHPVLATATITEAGDTLVASIGSVTNASANITESPDTATTDVDVVVSGSSAITEIGDSLSSGLTHPVLGTATISEAGDVLSAATSVLVSATATIAEAGDTLTASSSNQPVINGSLTVTEGPDTVAATTSMLVGGNATITEGGDSVSSSAVALVSAALAQIELPDGLTAQTAIRVLANATVNEAGDTLLATLVFNVNAALVANEAGDTLTAILRTLTEDAITYRERPLTYREGDLIYNYRR